MSIAENGRGEAGNSGQCDIMRGTGSDWAPHSRHMGMVGGGGQVAAVATGGTGGSGPTSQPPARSRDARGPGWGAGGRPQEARALTKRSGLALKSQSHEVAKIVAAVPTFRSQ